MRGSSSYHFDAHRRYQRLLYSIKRLKLAPFILLTVLCLVIVQVYHIRSKDEVVDTRISDKSSYHEAPAVVNIIKPGLDNEPTIDGSLTHIINDYDHDSEYHKNEDYADDEKLSNQLEKYKEFRQFIDKELLQRVLDTKPSFGSINNPEHYNQSNKHQTGIEGRMPVALGKLRENNAVDPVRSKAYLESFLLLSDDEKYHLTNSHRAFVEAMPSEYPENVAKSFKGNGILYAGSGEYNWLVLLSIRMLRELGSKLPVEVFIPNEDEYSYDLCERVFPAFGAKCLMMSNFINTKKIEVKGYQLKSIALLLSSFENVLMMDSDNLPLKNPDYLFINEPFVSQPLVVWPDFWRRSTSPMFYEIAGIRVNETNQVRYSFGDERDHPPVLESAEDYNSKISYHDLEGTFPEASSETGQLLISKKVHAKTIFLSLYYNYWGPNYYYPLFAQGQAGEGDKETLLAAAHKFGLPYYQVQEYIREYGEIYENGDIEIAAMGQYDPILDYMQTRNPNTFKSDYPYDKSKDNYLMHRFKNSEMFFLHCNQPKLYPWKIDGNGFRQVHTGDGKRRRLYSQLLVKEIGFDFELKVWEAMKWILCEHGDQLNIKGLNESPASWCGKVTDQLEFLEKDKITN